jgi:hypothetical protein
MTTTHQEKIFTQHAENTTWLNTLIFYRDDLTILKKRLEELVSKNNNKEFLKLVEHFQNQFIIQRNNIDELIHAIKSNENLLVKEVEENPVAVDRRKTAYHEKEKEMVESFEKNFNELRKEFISFCAKWM